MAAVVNPHGAFNPISCHLAWLTCRHRSMQYPLAVRWIVRSHKGGFSKQPMDASHMWQSTVFSGMRLSADQAYMHRLGHSLDASIMHACSIWAMLVQQWAAETFRARGSCASRQITYISRLILAHAFIESLLFPLGQMHKPGEI